jgi:hypothetical protein
MDFGYLGVKISTRNWPAPKKNAQVRRNPARVKSEAITQPPRRA